MEGFGNDPAVFFDRFCDLVNSITEEAWKSPEEGDCDNETLEVTSYSELFYIAMAMFVCFYLFFLQRVNY